MDMALKTFFKQVIWLGFYLAIVFSLNHFFHLFF
ncbi:hypothetical protein Ataiwa_29370 [Algoriphagus taiwanensis]|uniref:Uncharacterized protein n=1 Tax=Algoriphagus taiwanensis TaxID=1445656 RepID=A0ABQ6Q3A1_9BACT|nr:hypothetical protein Ataiwa_29370 [Algoriphagus taiwanensis]